MPYSKGGYVSTSRGPLVRWNYRPKKRPYSSANSAPPRSGRRVRRRVARSYTSVKRRRWRRRVAPAKSGDNSSHSKCVTGRRWSKLNGALFKKVMGLQTKCFNASYYWSSQVGGQGAYQISGLDRTMLQAVKTTLVGSTSNNCKIFLGYYKLRVHLKNQSNVVGKLTIYDIVTKFNPFVSSCDTPTESWNKGLGDMSTGAVTASCNMIGATPYVSPEFKKFFSIRKVTIVDMEPGQQHEHVRFHRVNRVINSTDFDDSPQVSIRGMTVFTLFVFHGSLMHEALDASKVTYSPMKLDYALTHECKFGSLSDTLPSYSVETAFPSTVVDGDVMGEAQDVNITPANV